MLHTSVTMEFRDRRWYEVIMIILGVVVSIGQLTALITPEYGPFSCIQLLVSAFFLGGGYGASEEKELTTR